jgi:N,N'-diacetylbacillosaminyl-diphospho-undecaprenol alpha-1,3-N-acetylgalactosaminyltransferase
MKEAMACGVPVVGANIGGIPEAIVDKETGLLFEANDPKDMVEKIKILVKDARLRKKLGEDSRKVAIQKFDFKNCAKSAFDILKKLISG